MEESTNVQFEPNQEMLQSLMNMGISKEAGEQALFITGNQSAEAAASFLFDNPDFDNSFKSIIDINGLDENDGSSSASEDIDYYKMVFVVNTSLKMGVGKIAAQVGHASLGLYRKMISNPEQCELVNKWEYVGEKKIVLKGRDQQHLEELQKLAEENKIPSCLIHDAGHTQIPSNSVTVLSLFGVESVINKITGKLNLL